MFNIESSERGETVKLKVSKDAVEGRETQDHIAQAVKRAKF